jgi:hypothetical protein
MALTIKLLHDFYRLQCLLCYPTCILENLFFERGSSLEIDYHEVPRKCQDWYKCYQNQRHLPP